MGPEDAQEAVLRRWIPDRGEEPVGAAEPAVRDRALATKIDQVSVARARSTADRESGGGGGDAVIDDVDVNVRPSLPDRPTHVPPAPYTFHPRPLPRKRVCYRIASSRSAAAPSGCGKYAFFAYCSTIRCVLKNEPLSAIAWRITCA